MDSGPTFTDAERELATRALAPEPPNVTTKGLARDANRVDDVPLEALDPVDPPKDSESK